jgi:haloalkane dehalogenase
MTRASFQSRFIDVDGERVHVVDEGVGPAVVLVHGSPISSFAFRHQIAALRQRHRVIAPDLLGFGDSSAPPGGAGFARQADVLRRVLDELDVGPHCLLGHDWGGPIALGSAARRPAQVDRLVLMNTTFDPAFAPPRYWQHIIRPGVGELVLVRLNLVGLWLPVLMRAARRRAVRRVYAARFRQPGTRRTVLALERQTNYRPLMRDVVAALPHMQVPTLILWGDPDPYFCPGTLERLRQLMPHARVTTLARAGHFPMEDAPAATTTALEAFLGP